MSWTKLGMLLLFAILLACGQILFKIAAQSLKWPMRFNYETALQLMLNPYLLIALALYAMLSFLWLWLLKDTELNKAYLVLALSIVLVTLAGTFLLREPISARLVVGMAIVLLGLVVALW